ncbi:MAG: four helix bundle protein [Gemmatimonadales bacterium]
MHIVLGMAGIRRFEDLIAWQKARILTRKVYRVSRAGDFARDYDLARQIRSAAVSVMANVAEGFERSRRGELLQFLSVAKASCGEVRSHLYVAVDAGYLPEREFDHLKKSTEEVSRILGGFRASLAAERRVSKHLPS